MKANYSEKRTAQVEFLKSTQRTSVFLFIHQQFRAIQPQIFEFSLQNIPQKTQISSTPGTPAATLEMHSRQIEQTTKNVNELTTQLLVME